MKRMSWLRLWAVLGFAMGLGIIFLAYCLGGHGLLDPKGSKEDAFIIVLMVYSGFYAMAVPADRYLVARARQAEERAAYRAHMKNTFALFNKDYWNEHNLDDFPKDKSEVKRLGIDKELPTAHDCRVHLYGYDPYEKNPPPKMPGFNSDFTAIEVDGQWHRVPLKYRGMPVDEVTVNMIIKEIKNQEGHHEEPDSL